MVYQSGGGVKRQPSSELWVFDGLVWALGLPRAGWWVSAQPAGSPAAPVPPTLLPAGAMAAAC